MRSSVETSDNFIIYYTLYFSIFFVTFCQVVTSLRHITEGKLKESSPVESYPESQKSAEKGRQSKEKTTGDKSLRRVQSYSIKGQMSGASSSSEAIPTKSTRLGKSMSSGKTYNEKTEKSQSRTQLHYEEMLV